MAPGKAPSAWSFALVCVANVDTLGACFTAAAALPSACIRRSAPTAMITQATKFLFGYDVFISYPYADGKNVRRETESVNSPIWISHAFSTSRSSPTDAS